MGSIVWETLDPFCIFYKRNQNKYTGCFKAGTRELHMTPTSLNELFKNAEIPLSPEQLELLQKYKQFLMESNKSKNLISRKSADTFDLLHLLDSAIPLSKLPRLNPVIDLGSGGGLPGIVLKIMEPGIDMTLCESKAKKINFLQKCIEILNLEGIRVFNPTRQKPEKKYGLLVCRAFGSLRKIRNVAKKYLAKGGKIAAYKGRADTLKEELKILGPDKVRIIPYHIADGDSQLERHLIIIE